MAITHIQTASNGTVSGSSTSATVTAIGSGHLVAGFAVWDSAVLTDFISVTDNQGNTYTIVDKVSAASNGFNHSWGSFYCPNITNGPVTITANYVSATPNIAIFLDEYSGVATTSPLDGHAMSTQLAPGTGADGCTSGNITTTVAGDLIYSGMVDVQGITGSNASGTSFTLRVNNDASNGQSFSCTEDRIQVAAGSIAGTFTLSANAVTVCGVMAFSPPSIVIPQGWTVNNDNYQRGVQQILAY